LQEILLSTITIDHSIPAPKHTAGRSRERKFAFHELREIGDSFFVPEIILSGIAGYWEKKLGITITRKAVTENGVAGTRFWRIA